MEIEKVYRVTNYALSTNWFDARTNKDLVEKHGYLWKCLELDTNDFIGEGYFTCVSLATGAEKPWCEDELEEVT